MNPGIQNFDIPSETMTKTVGLSVPAMAELLMKEWNIIEGYWMLEFDIPEDEPYTVRNVTLRTAEPDEPGAVDAAAPRRFFPLPRPAKPELVK